MDKNFAPEKLRIKNDQETDQPVHFHPSSFHALIDLSGLLKIGDGE